MNAEKEIDAVTGTDTTGQVWDGIRELNTPLPKWWLYTFYATILWSVVYCVLYPAVPWITGHTTGILGHTERTALAARLADVRAERAGTLNRIAVSEVSEILEDTELARFALAGGGAAFADNCTPCHGTGGTGRPGYPILADDAWIWGGTPDDIHTTILHGVRWEEDEDTRYSEMPVFGNDYLETAAIRDVTEHVLALGGRDADAAAAARGAAVFAEECAYCHGDQGEGMAELGAPNLTDAIWLRGGAREEIFAQIYRPTHGVMPSWQDRLDPATLKMLAAYVHALGGGN